MKRCPLVDKASVSEVRDRLRRELVNSGADEEAAFDCLVAVTEACSNAFMHGHCRETVDRPPVVEWDITPQAVTVVIRDFSNHGWEATSYPSVPFDAAMGGAEDRIGGLGLTLMSELMDDVRMDRTESGTRVTLIKTLLAPAPSGVS
jgi:anti-sigma regulatory factor (Ser/Thr protein kinase)